MYGVYLHVHCSALKSVEGGNAVLSSEQNVQVRFALPEICNIF